jgi:DNA modification methylase
MSLLMVQADARHLPFADGCVQCVVTSPPYWGLRDYGTARWDGGDAECDHIGPPMRTNNKQSDSSASFHGGTTRANEFYRDTCGKCGATRIDAQLGLESTPDAYVQGMVAVFREVWRVLRDDGVCWLNLGDSYTTGASVYPRASDPKAVADLSRGMARIGTPIGLKAKDLVGIPWRVAFALQADGWYLRSDAIWSKPNPMPESVTDRPTKSHEYVFLLTKAATYYWDADAVKEPAADSVVARAAYKVGGVNRDASRNDSDIGRRASFSDYVGGRNMRSVWHIATQPYPGAHFATMPEALVSRCIRAASRSGDVVLDPFMGSGTVARTALKLGRRAIGCDLNPAYLALADDRTRVTYGLPLEGEDVA